MDRNNTCQYWDYDKIGITDVASWKCGAEMVLKASIPDDSLVKGFCDLADGKLCL